MCLYIIQKGLSILCFLNMCYKRQDLSTYNEVSFVVDDFFNYLISSSNIKIANYSEKDILNKFKKYSKCTKTRYYVEDKRIDVNNFDELKKNVFIHIDLRKLTRNLPITFGCYQKSLETINVNLKHCENLEKKDNNIYEERRIKIIKNKNLLLKKELEEKGLQGIFKHALSNSYKLTTPLIDQFFNIYNHVIKNKFYDPRYNDNILMLFSQMPLNSILSEQKILEFKSNKPNVYKQIIKKYLKDYNVLNEIIEIVSNNYIIDERQWIIEKGIEFYNKREYLLSITTLITQVEGIINDSLLLTDKENVAITQTLSTKIDEAEFSSIMHFIKYTFEEVRNKITHGHIPRNELIEMNFVIISSLHYVLTTLFKDTTFYNYSKIIQFLEKWKNKKDDNLFELFNVLGSNLEVFEKTLFISEVNHNYIKQNNYNEERKSVVKFITSIKTWISITNFQEVKEINLKDKLIKVHNNFMNIENITDILQITIRYFKKFNHSKLQDENFKKTKKHIFKSLKQRKTYLYSRMKINSYK